MPGSTPATSQLDWLISTTAMIVLSWSKATRDLLKSFGWGIRALHQLVAATMVPSPRRLPHTISPLEGSGFEPSVPRDTTKVSEPAQVHSAGVRALPRAHSRSASGSARAPGRANRPRSDQTNRREDRPPSRPPNPEPATSCYCWSWRGLHRRSTPGSFGFQPPETTPPSIPTTLLTEPQKG